MPPRPRARLDLEDDPDFQRRFWIVERWAWAGYALLIAAALLGFTGSGGVFARATAETPYASVDYPRVSRWQAADHMRIHLSGAVGQEAQIALDRRFLELFEVTGVQPQPERAAATARGTQYTFAVGPGGGAVNFHIRATRPAFSGDIGVWVEDSETRMRPLILP